MKGDQPPSNIDDYIAGFPEDIKSRLQHMRQTIRDAAPGATEAISYQMPTFKLHGNLVHFAAFKRHVGFYPGGAVVEHFADELSGFETSKGTIRFPFDKPIPYDLVAKIVSFRVTQNLEKAASPKRRKAK